MLYESKELTPLALSGKAPGKGIMKIFKKKIKPPGTTVLLNLKDLKCSTF